MHDLISSFFSLGGQKARINLARSIYFQADILCLDDPLAAVDPGISAGLFWTIHNLQNTRILVTHAIHFLPHVDMIITLSEGKVAEIGSFNELRSQDGPFARLMRDFANEDSHEKEMEDDIAAAEQVDHRPAAIPRERLTAQVGKALMTNETMGSGSMKKKTFGGYLKAGRGPIMIPLGLITIIISQTITIITAYCE